jgi:glycosyltransferase involved in cell wall biosynthesis
MRPPSVAFVVQRCGEEVVGGAESLCLQIAEQLNHDLRIEVLTTCALDYMTWRNRYPSGNTHERGVHVHRFPVDVPRDVRRFNELSSELRELGEAAPLATQEAWMRAQGPCSRALTQYLRAHAARFDTIAFFGYSYATAYFNLPFASDRAVLWPFAHDEWTFRLSMWDDFFARVGHVVYSSAEEQTLVTQRFPALAARTDLIDTGVRMPTGVQAQRFRERFGISGPFVLYLGRLDPSKGCDTLLAYFQKFAAGDQTGKKLVLIGDAQMEIPAHPAIVHVGRVDESTKWDALAAAELLVLPSPHESLSLAVLEAWAAGKPVLVNAISATLVGQCRRSNGGLWYGTYDEFAAALSLLDPETGLRLGLQGRAFVDGRYRWDDATARYREILGARREGAGSGWGLAVEEAIR